MTPRQFSIMSHKVIDPEAWYQHNVNLVGKEEADKRLEAKCLRWEAEYLRESAKPGYQDRAQRQAIEDAKVEAEIAENLEAARLAALAKKEEFNTAVDARVRAILEEMKIG